jgi:xanthine/CO dehydrogenase XdhC/CoxF family maturation factor
LLATVVNVRGSSYRRPGARMLIAEDRVVVGSVSGGCLEGELVRRGWWHTRDGGPALLRFESFDDDDNDSGDRPPHARTGCGGMVEILLERVEPGAASDPLELLDAAIADEATVEMLTVFRSRRPDMPVGVRRVLPPVGRLAAAVPSVAPWTVLLERARWSLTSDSKSFAIASLPDGSVEALAERLRPPPHLFVFGSGPDAAPVVTLARTLGWTVTVWDPRARFQTKARFAAADHLVAGDLEAVRARIAASARPLAVIMAHDLEHDRQALQLALSSPASYVGVLGPRRRTERLLGALPGGGALTDEQRRRLHAPVGLQLGAETPDEIALSIVAQAQAVLALAAAGHLRDQAQPIHAAATTTERPAARLAVRR